LFHVADEIRHVVGFQSVSQILPVITLVVENNVETIREQAPKGHIRVDGKAVAVAQNQASTFGIAVPTNTDGRSVSHCEIEHLMRRGDDQSHCKPFLGYFCEGYAGRKASSAPKRPLPCPM